MALSLRCFLSRYFARGDAGRATLLRVWVPVALLSFAPVPLIFPQSSIVRTTPVWKITAAALIVVAGIAAPASAETRDEAWARDRCLKDGLKAGTPEMATCIRYTVAWLEKSRRDSQRLFN